MGFGYRSHGGGGGGKGGGGGGGPGAGKGYSSRGASRRGGRKDTSSGESNGVMEYWYKPEFIKMTMKELNPRLDADKSLSLRQKTAIMAELQDRRRGTRERVVRDPEENENKKNGGAAWTMDMINKAWIGSGVKSVPPTGSAAATSSATTSSSATSSSNPPASSNSAASSNSSASSNPSVCATTAKKPITMKEKLAAMLSGGNSISSSSGGGQASVTSVTSASAAASLLASASMSRKEKLDAIIDENVARPNNGGDVVKGSSSGQQSEVPPSGVPPAPSSGMALAEQIRNNPNMTKQEKIAWVLAQQKALASASSAPPPPGEGPSHGKETSDRKGQLPGKGTATRGGLPTQGKGMEPQTSTLEQAKAIAENPKLTTAEKRALIQKLKDGSANQPRESVDKPKDSQSTSGKSNSTDGKSNGTDKWAGWTKNANGYLVFPSTGTSNGNSSKTTDDKSSRTTDDYWKGWSKDSDGKWVKTDEKGDHMYEENWSKKEYNWSEKDDNWSKNGNGWWEKSDDNWKNTSDKDGWKSNDWKTKNDNWSNDRCKKDEGEKESKVGAIPHSKELEMVAANLAAGIIPRWVSNSLKEDSWQIIEMEAFDAAYKSDDPDNSPFRMISDIEFRNLSCMSCEPLSIPMSDSILSCKKTDVMSSSNIHDAPTEVGLEDSWSTSDDEW